MKEFLKKITAIFITFILILATAVISLQIIVDSNATFKLDNESIILGHSQPECAFNDSLIPGFKNVSESGEPYFYTYIKCKKILAENPQIKNVFIQFGVNNISKIMDSWTWKNKSIYYRYPRFSPFMTTTEHKTLLLNNPKGFFNSLPIFIKYQAKRLLRTNFNYSDILGGHVSHDPWEIDPIEPDLLDKDFPKENDISSMNILILQRIILLCQQNNINVYLVRCPVMIKNEHSESEILFEKIRGEYFSEIDFLDFSAFPLHNSDFLDSHHLNKLGANKFSIWFNKHIKTIIK